MSFQTEVSASKLAKEVQEYVDLGDHTELILSDLGNGKWRITADSKQFWTQALTPSEAEELRKERDRYREERDDYMHLLQIIVNPCGHHVGLESIRMMARTELDKYGRDYNWQTRVREVLEEDE